MVSKVLIANRGEVACRIIKTCQDLNLTTVAVYSEADSQSRHVQMADEAYQVGPSPVSESYLNIDRILKVVEKSGARFVHPGYGLLSENPTFAQRVEKQGIRWVGPSPECMIAMADKERARSIAVDAGLPVLKGSKRIASDCSKEIDLDGLVAEIGLPLLIKAVAGGGGIGMRKCTKIESLGKDIRRVSDLAGRIFGDDTVIVERYIERARHVEVQIFGLEDGQVISLFDRDCSTQRRFQKIVEEAPAPSLPDNVRTKMSKVACNLAVSQNYRGVGTVEFIFDVETKEFFFLEMNTRLQVEHPVTEMITGLDLVALQLKLAAGASLDDLPGSVMQRAGHAIECRIYAENPQNRFFPSPGTVTKLKLPEETTNVRVDIGVVKGSEITPYYDPLIGKLICSGTDRDEARKRLVDSLKSIEIDGLMTNIPFLREYLVSDFFDQTALCTDVVHRFMGMKSGKNEILN